jgi:hypothetical protein
MLMRATRLILTLIVFLSTVSPAAAQGKTMSVGVGYQALEFEESSFPVGLNVDFEAGMTDHIALVGESGWARASTQQFGLRDITNGLHAAGGGRWTISRRRIRPFGQLLIGVERDRTEIEQFGSDWASAFLFQPGGGIVVHVHGGQDLFGQVDLHRVTHEDESANAVRFLAGLRLNIR